MTSAAKNQCRQRRLQQDADATAQPATYLSKNKKKEDEKELEEKHAHESCGELKR